MCGRHHLYCRITVIIRDLIVVLFVDGVSAGIGTANSMVGHIGLNNLNPYNISGLSLNLRITQFNREC
jgi:hypothetical protein